MESRSFSLETMLSELMKRFFKRDADGKLLWRMLEPPDRPVASEPIEAAAVTYPAVPDAPPDLLTLQRWGVNVDKRHLRWVTWKKWRDFSRQALGTQKHMVHTTPFTFGRTGFSQCLHPQC